MLTLGRLATCVWENPKLTTKTKMALSDACVVSTFLYVSEAWKIYSRQERKLNIVSTYEASAASSVSAGETRCPTLRSWTAPVSPLRIHYSGSAECAELAMCAAWRMEEYLRTSSMENLPLANDLVATHS